MTRTYAQIIAAAATMPVTRGGYVKPRSTLRGLVRLLFAKLFQKALPPLPKVCA